MFGVTTEQINRGLYDLLSGIKDWRLWHFLAWQEIKQRYRRSTLGPFWMSLNMAVQMATMGLLVSALFGHSYSKFLPYVCAGYIVWNLLAGILTESTSAFASSGGFILQQNRPFFSYILLSVWRQLIIFWHNAVVLAGLLLIFGITPNANLALLLVSLPLSILSVMWIGLVCATIAVRFRDVQLIVMNAMTVLFWLTPIIYYHSQLSGKAAFLISLNPFTHIIEIVRGPLLGTTPSLVNWSVVILLTVLGWAGALLVFSKFRARISYWL